MYDTFTFHYEDIIETYEDWQSNVSNAVIDELPPPASQYSAFDLWFYSQMDRLYFGRSINYDMPNVFIKRLRLLYANILQLYMRKKELIEATYNLTNEELELINKSVTNSAHNPNVEAEDPTAPLPFVSDQTYSEFSNSKIQSYLFALQSIVDIDIVGMFHHQNGGLSIDSLFSNIADSDIWLYEK